MLGCILYFAYICDFLSQILESYFKVSFLNYIVSCVCDITLCHYYIVYSQLIKEHRCSPFL